MYFFVEPVSPGCFCPWSEMKERLPNEPVYIISVAAKLAGLPCWTLRALDQDGVVVPVRTEKNRRMYSDDDISTLEYVRYLTEERGVNTAGVKMILEIEGRLPKDSQKEIVIPNGISVHRQIS